jgi:prevent-host-death family protein
MDHVMVYFCSHMDHSSVPAAETCVKISVTDAKGQLTDLVRRAEAGDEIVLTRHGHAAARLVPVRAATNRRSREALLESVRAAAAAKASHGASAARSQDFLYDEGGLSR